MILRAAPCLLSSTATLDDINAGLGERFVTACDVHGYVGVVLEISERCMLQAASDAMQERTADVLADRYDGIDSIPTDRESDVLRNSLIVIQAKAVRRLQADLMHIPKFSLTHLMTEAEAVDLIERGIPALTINLGHLKHGAVLHCLRRDVAQALSDMHLLLFSLDVEASARKRCTHMDDHERPARRAADVEEEARLFAESYPDFHAIRSSLCDKLQALEAQLDDWLVEHKRPTIR